MAKAPARGAPSLLGPARAGNQGHWNGYVLLIKFLLHRKLREEHDQMFQRALASGESGLSSMSPYCMNSPLNDVAAVSSGLRNSVFLIGDIVDAAVVPEQNSYGIPCYILYIETRTPANSNNIKKYLTNLELPKSPHHRFVIEDADVYLDNNGKRPAPIYTVRALNGVAASPKLMDAMQREEQAHQQLFMIEAAEAVGDRASAGSVLSIEDVSHELGFTQAELAAGLQNIALQRAQEGVDEQRRKLEAYQSEHLRLINQIKELEPEVHRQRGIMAGLKAELASNVAAYNEIQAQLKTSRRTLWRACRAHDFTHEYDYDTETAILTPVVEGEDAYTRQQRIHAGNLSLDVDAIIVERQQAAREAIDAEFEARRIQAENVGESAEEAEQNGDY
ncbi:hypothetical protein JKP88DRAFT_252813 [Tribonema minus]|uniref:Uncharacterized protein n=1 Tax=Tribonema minus TaxID=303371 RepID=A0A835ZIB2_9STRA|nr:hypothetical protein JKP88DRAFT_252813 [Tribonema minus]